MLGEDDSELRRIDEECANQSETQPTDSLTGLEEALEELRRLLLQTHASWRRSSRLYIL